MIERISLKNIATYDSNGIIIDNLGKINFIYGSNGTGKTTISNFLQDYNSERYSDCFIQWKNEELIKTLVYNKEFRNQNFGKGKINGVFTLGSATKNVVDAIKKKTKAFDEVKKVYDKKKETCDNQYLKVQELEANFKKLAWDNIYKKYEVRFKDALRGYLNQQSFKNKLLEEFPIDTSPISTIEDLNNRYLTVFGKNHNSLDIIEIDDYSELHQIECNEIWIKKIVGKQDIDISNLIQSLNISDWVYEGQQYIQEYEKICPFCQQATITDDFRNKLNSYFDETYLADINLMQQLKDDYIKLSQDLVESLDEIVVKQEQINTKLNIDKFSICLNSIKQTIAINKKSLETKISEPSRVIEFITLDKLLKDISSLIAAANNEVRRHNDMVSNLYNEREDLKIAVWRYITNEFQEDIEVFNRNKRGLERGIHNLEKELRRLKNKCNDIDTKIKDLNKQITSIQPTIDEINRTLKSFGFLSFEIIASEEDGFYQLQRENGDIAESTLSEGEETFITFLYFLQLAKGGITQEEIHKNRILVIDDPISSLDSNVLFLVSTLIKEIIKEVKADVGFIKQVLVLTHNVYFHREVSYEGLSRKGEKSLFWILRKKNNITSIYSYDENPIKSSYELLWREVKECEKNSGITIQNVLRRILENYFSILGNKWDDILLDKFPTPEEKEICRSLLSWSNEGSHTFSDDLYVEVPNDTIEVYLDVFKDIFEYTDNIGHYNMMMGLIP